MLAQQHTPPLNSERRAAVGSDPTVLTDIYAQDVNIAIWKRELPSPFCRAVRHLLRSTPDLQLSLHTQAERTGETLTPHLEHAIQEPTLRSAFVREVSNTIDMFCCLFELDRVGLRLSALSKAMCPRFHVDRVPARLVTTYSGNATQWLPHNRINRSLLGPQSTQAKADQPGRLYPKAEDVQQLNTGDVAILKGELWEGNQGAGLVHRSPWVTPGERRLLMTLDFLPNA